MRISDWSSDVCSSDLKQMVRVPLKEGRTLHHDGKGHFGAGKVTLRSAPAGTGIIAGGPMRAVFERLGVADVVTKSVGTSNPYNMIRATFRSDEHTSELQSLMRITYAVFCLKKQ